MATRFNITGITPRSEFIIRHMARSYGWTLAECVHYLALKWVHSHADEWRECERRLKTNDSRMAALQRQLTYDVAEPTTAEPKPRRGRPPGRGK